MVLYSHKKDFYCILKKWCIESIKDGIWLMHDGGFASFLLACSVSTSFSYCSFAS